MKRNIVVAALAALALTPTLIAAPAAGAAPAVQPGAPQAVSALATVKYYYRYEGSDYVGGGYGLKVKYAGSKIYINDPGTGRCYTARRVATNKWKYIQPNASSEPGNTVGYATTNSAKTWFKMSDQYGRGRFKVVSKTKADAWARQWRTLEPSFSWVKPPC